jgi:carboxylesterase type B
VGILGFLDGGNDFPTVNMGLQDTILALTWVKNNIMFFGGDPSRVTGTPSQLETNLVFGESSGGSMIRALMSSRKASNLFKRAIIQSDPQNYPLESRAVSRDIVGSYALGQLGCNNVACARAASLSSIVAATTQTTNNGPFLDASVPVTPLFPAIDGTWVQGDFSKLITSGTLPNEVQLMMGTTLIAVC